jgi:hypothetical protein
MSDFRKFVKPLLSLFIVLVLGFQVAATFRVLCPPARLGLPQIACEPSTWPFVNYPMYSQAHYAGEKLNQFFVYGLLPDLSEVPIVPRDLGITFYQFQALVEALNQGNMEESRFYAQEYEIRHDQPLIGLRLESHPMILEEGGWREGEPETLEQMVFEEERS